jgi:hypothetical protein
MAVDTFMVGHRVHMRLRRSHTSSLRKYMKKRPREYDVRLATLRVNGTMPRSRWVDTHKRKEETLIV